MNKQQVGITGLILTVILTGASCTRSNLNYKTDTDGVEKVSLEATSTVQNPEIPTKNEEVEKAGCFEYERIKMYSDLIVTFKRGCGDNVVQEESAFTSGILNMVTNHDISVWLVSRRGWLESQELSVKGTDKVTDKAGWDIDYEMYRKALNGNIKAGDFTSFGGDQGASLLTYQVIQINGSKYVVGLVKQGNTLSLSYLTYISDVKIVFSAGIQPDNNSGFEKILSMIIGGKYNSSEVKENNEQISLMAQSLNIDNKDELVEAIVAAESWLNFENTLLKESAVFDANHFQITSVEPFIYEIPEGAKFSPDYRDLLGVYSPDKSKLIDPNIYLAAYEKSKGDYRLDFDVDSVPLLYDLKQQKSTMIARMCGTPCMYEDAFWIDNDRFVLVETGLRDNERGNETDGTFLSLIVVDLNKKTKRTYSYSTALFYKAGWGNTKTDYPKYKYPQYNFSLK